MEDTLTIQEEVQSEQPQQQDPPSKKLYNGLIEEKLYTKSYDEFVKQYSTPESRKKLYTGLVEEKLYSKGENDFVNQYFPEPVKKKVGSNVSPPVSGNGSSTTLKPSLKDLGINPTTVPSYAQGGLQPVSTQVVQPKITATYDDFKLHNAEYTVKKKKLRDEAVENTARKYLKNKGVIVPNEDGKALNISEYMQLSKEKKRFQEALDNGDATFAISEDGEMGLKRTTGWWESLKKGWNESMQGNDEAKAFANDMDAAQKVEFLKKKEAEVAHREHPEYLGERGSAMGSIGGLIGENAPFMIKATEGALAGTALVAAAPETLGASLAGLPAAMSFIFTAEDSKNQGVMAEVTRRYAQLKKENPNTDEVELMKQAEQGVLVGGLTGIATNAALMKSVSTPLTNMTKGVVGKSITKAIGTTVYGAAATAGLEGAKIAEGNLEGIKATSSDVAKQMGTIFSESATTLGMLHVLTGAVGKAFTLPKMVRSAVKYSLVKEAKPQDLQAVLKANEEAGKIPEGITEQVMGELSQYKAALDKTIDGLSPESEAAVAGLIEAKTKLIEEQKTKDDSEGTKAYYKEKIEGINQQIDKINNTNKPYAYEIDEMSGNTYKSEVPKTKGEPEQISEPIELSTEVSTPTGVIDFDLNQVKKPGGSIGNQGASPEQANGVLNHIGIDVKFEEEPTLKEMVAHLKDNPKDLQKLVDFTKKNPIELRELPDGTYQLEDGHHRAALLYHAGVENAPSVIKNAGEYIPENKSIQSEQTKADLPNTETPVNTTNEAVGSNIGTPAETTGAGGKEPPSAGAVNIPVGDGKEMIGISHAEFNKVAEEIGLPKYEKDTQTIEQWHQQADVRIAKGEMPKVISKMEAGEIPTEVEQLMIGKYVAGLKDEFNKTGSDAVLKELYKVKQLSDKEAGAAWGRSGRARQELLPVQPLDGGLASAMIAKMEANKTDVLTESQKAEVVKQVEEYKAAAEKEQALRQEAEAKYAELLAQKEVDKTSKETKKTKSATPKTSEDFKKERSEIKQSIKDKLRKARGETNAVIIPYAKELIAIAPDVLRLAKSYVEEGVIKLSDIVAKAHAEMKEYIPEIKEDDIRDIIAGKYNDKKATRNELQAQWMDLQTEAKLLNEYDRILRGEPKTEKEQRKKNETLTELRKRIDAKKLEESNAEKFEKKVKDLEDELKRVQLRKSKEKVEKGSPAEKEISEKEQELLDKIEKENESWNEEKDNARKIANEYQKLETERNRQLKRVSDLKEKLDVLQSGRLPETKTNTPKVDTPEIEALKKEIEVAEKAVRGLNAHEKKMIGLEADLHRIKDRKDKEKKPESKRVISEEEKLKRDEIEAEQKAWDIEKNIEKLNADLQRVKDRKQKAITPKKRRDLTAVEESIAKQIKAEKEVWAKEIEPQRKLRQALDNAQKSLDEYERRINEKDTAPKATQPVKETPELKALRDKVKEAKERYNKVRNETGAASAQKLKNMVASNDRAAAKLLQRIADEDFAPEKPPSFFENFELKQQHPELYNDVINAIHRKEEARHKFDISLALDAAEKESAGMKVYKGAGKLKNTFQQLAAGVDDSLMFVQLGHTLLRNPSTALNFKMIKDVNGKNKFVLGGAIKEHVLDAISEKRFNREMTALHNSQMWPLIKASGLDVLEPQSLLSQMKEEMFQNSYADKVGTSKYNLGKFLKIWERAYTSLGNNVRVNLFLKQTEQMYKNGMTIENNLAEFQGLAKAINNLTGRGTSHPKMAQVIPLVTPVIWSPKMIASSVNLLGLTDITGKGAGFYSKLPPKARRYAISQMAGGIGIGVSVMTAAAIGGAIVHHDPRDPQFGEVQYGDDDEKSFNVFGRYAGYIKLLAQIWPSFLGGGRKNKQGEVESMYTPGGKKGGEVVGSFFRGKMNPVSGLAYDYLANDQKGFYDNKPLTLGKSAEQLMMPMSLRNVSSTLERDGTMGLLNYSLPNFVGIQMKDARDFNDTGFSTEVATFMRKKKLKIRPPSKDKDLSDEEYQEFVKRRNERLEAYLKQLQEKGLEDGATDDESYQDAADDLESRANEMAKDEVLGTKPTPPKKPKRVKDFEETIEFKRKEQW